MSSFLVSWPALATILALVTKCCVGRGCTNLDVLLESSGSVYEQLNLTTVALDVSGSVAFAVNAANGSLVRKSLRATGTGGGSSGSGIADWAFLNPSVGSHSLLGAISLSRGVPPPALSVSDTRPGAPALLATVTGSHCIFGVAIDVEQAMYSTSRYAGSCERGSTRGGTFDSGTYHTPRYLVLTRSSTVLYVVEKSSVRALNYSSNRLYTIMQLTSSDGDAILGASLSPDEQILFLSFRDGSIRQLKVDARHFASVLLLAGYGDSFLLIATAAPGAAGQIARAAVAAGATTAVSSCPEERYVLVSRSGLATAIAGTSDDSHTKLNITWSMNATVLCAVVCADGQTVLVITSHEATDSRPGGIEYQLVTYSPALTVERSSDLNTISSNKTSPVGTTVSALRDSLASAAAVNSPPSSRSVASVTDTETVAIAAGTTADTSVASQMHDLNHSATASFASEATTSTAALVSNGSVVQLQVGHSPSATVDDHLNVILISSITAGIACACLLAAGAFVLARRIRWSLLWKNRRLLVKLGPQGDDIILVPSDKYCPGSDATNGGCDFAVAVDCEKDLAAAAAAPAVPQRQS